MSRNLLSLVGVSGLLLTTYVSAATAADMRVKAPPVPIPAYYDWTGLYVGANGGYGWGHNCWTFDSAPPVADGCFNSSGGLAGGQIGYNFQARSVVFGLELSGDWAKLTGQFHSTTFPQDLNNWQASGIWMATGRVGWAVNQSLFYVKGGAAGINEKYFGSCFGNVGAIICPAGQVYTQASETRIGGAIGVGLEYGLTRNLSIAAEYDYLLLGNRTVPFSIVTACGAPCTWDISQNVSLLTLRLNYRFGGPPTVSAKD